MLLKEALEQLHDGKVLCRSKWSLEDGYLKIMPGMDFVWKIILKPTPNAGNYIFCIDDLKSDDWQEFELSKEAIAVEVASAA